MSGFSADWLSLREPADAKARHASLLEALGGFFKTHERIGILDLGCGTGSNLRHTAQYLPEHAYQHWHLVDHDAALLQAAEHRLTDWAGSAGKEGGALRLTAFGRRIEVTFQQMDLHGGVDGLSFGSVNLITASALFDLVSEAWMTKLVTYAQHSKAAVYAALSYNGQEVWMPPHPADGPMLAAFHVHQRGDKGFGPAAGPAAAQMLKDKLEQAHYEVKTGDSTWKLTQQDNTSLIAALAEGSANAVRELRLFDEDSILNWLKSRKSAESCFIGHTDVLGLFC